MRLITCVVLVTLPGCFCYPGEGKCEPTTYKNVCRAPDVAVNCSNVTPVGFGMGVVPRWAVLVEKCTAENQCVELNAVAACVAEADVSCEHNSERCRAGVLENCRLIGSMDGPLVYRWVRDADAPSCAEETKPAYIPAP